MKNYMTFETFLIKVIITKCINGKSFGLMHYLSYIQKLHM